MLGPGAVVVLETKTYSGRVTGAVEDFSWTQHLRAGELHYELLNPLLQNGRHVRAVRAQFPSRPPPIAGHVVSAGTAIFEGAIGEVIVPLSRLAGVLGSLTKPELRPSGLHAAWQVIEIAVQRGEALRERRDQTLARRSVWARPA